MKKIYSITLWAFSFSLFTSLCGAQAFAGLTFDSLSTGMTSPGAYVLSLAMKDSTQESHLFAGGHFKIAGRKAAVNIAEWMDTINSDPPVNGKWIPLGTGVDSDVCALAMFGKYLYSGGKFDTAGGIASSHIARWDTAKLQWDSLLGKLNGNVYALCVYNNALYVGGDFTIANSDTVNRIAVWKDSVWASVGKGFDTGAVYALTVSNDTLYAGGSFLKANNIRVNHVAKLSGNKWDSLGSGTNNTVYALSPGLNYNELVVGGAFTKSENLVTHHISVFEEYNQTWSNLLEPGTNDTVRALNNGWGAIALIVKKHTGQGIGGGNVIVAGGNFDSAGGYRSHYIAGWDFTGWDTIGELNGPVYALSNPYNSFGGNNYVGGDFSYAHNGITHSSDTVNNVAYMFIFLGGGIQSITDNSNVEVYPNPGKGKFTFEIKNEEQSVNAIEVYNVLGEKVYSEFVIPNTQFLIDLSNQPNGIYLMRILDKDGNLVANKKIVKTN